MRLLRLLDDDFALEFHPYVTVISGLEEPARQRVVDVLAGLPRGESGELGGLVESHGVVLDLDTESLGLLELGQGDGEDVDVIVTSDSLPGGGGSRSAHEVSGLEREAATLTERLETADADVLRQREAVGEAEIEVERAAKVIDDLESARAVEEEASIADDQPSRETRVAEVAAAAALLAECESTLGAARERLAEAEAVAAAARTLRDETTSEASALAGQLEAAEASIDREAEADLEAAEARLVALREEVERERESEAEGQLSADDQESIEHRLARLEVQRTELDAKIAVLGGAETLAVEAAIEGLRGGDGVEPQQVLSPDALALADEIERGRARIAAESGGLSDNEGTVIAARARLDAARQALADTEQQVRLPQLDRDDIDALELAHANVLDAQEKSEGRFGKARGERRLDEARAEEDEVLARLGFESYADYMMGTSILHVDDELETELDRARAELADAEDAWAALQEGVDSTLETTILKDNLRLLTEQAAVMLGSQPEGDVVEALRGHRVAANPIGDAHGRLVAALQTVGLAVDQQDLEADELVLLAEDWMAEERAANELRERALAERAEVDLALAETRSELSQAAAGMSGPSQEDRRKARIDDAVAARDSAEQRLIRHASIIEEVDEFRAALAGLTERVEAANVEAADAERKLERIAAEVADAEAARDATAAAHLAVEQSLAEFDEPVAEDSTEAVDAERDAAIQAREAAAQRLSEAREALALAEARAAEVGEEHAELQARITAARATPTPDDVEPGASAEEVEWYLLSRLAAQRRISFAGSVPMLIDRALDDLTAEEIQVVLDRLERMAAAVQLLVISDTDAARTWAERAGEQRGAVVHPMKPADVVPFA